MEEAPPKTVEAKPTKFVFRELLRKTLAREKKAPLPGRNSPSRSSTARSQDLASGGQTDKPMSSAGIRAQPYSVSASLPESVPESLPGAHHPEPLSRGDRSQDAQSQPPTSPPQFSSLRNNTADAFQLWATAYHEIKANHPKHFDHYEEILSGYLGQEDKLAETDEDIKVISSHETAGGTLQKRMDAVLESWFTKHLPATDGGDDWEKSVSLVRDAWKKISQPSLPWVAVCLSLEAAFNHPERFPRGIFPGIASILSRLEWYCLFSDLLPRDNTSGTRVDFKGLEHALLNLYRTVLYHCLQIICTSGPYFDELDFADAEALKAVLSDKENALPASIEGQQIDLQLRRLFESTDFVAHPHSNENAGSEAESETGSEAESETESKAESEIESEIESETALRTTEAETSDDETEEAVVELFNSSNVSSADSSEEVSIPQFWKTVDLDHFYDNVSELLTSTLQKLQDWGSKNDNRVLWVSGGPGAGKTTILAAIARKLLLSERKISGNNALYSVLCCGEDQGSDSLAMVVTSLVDQILKRQDDLRHHLDKKNELIGREDSNGQSTFPVMSEVLHSMIKDENFLPAYFVVDSADDCSTGNDSADTKESAINQLTALISATTEDSTKVRWLLSIDSLAKDGRVREGQLHLDLDAETVALQPAAEHHVASGIQKLTRDPTQGIQSQSEAQVAFLAKSKGNFLWINLALNVIEGYGTPWNILHILNGLPEGVSAFYRHSLGETAKLPWHDAIYCERILQFAAMAFRPLLIEELKAIAQLPPGLDLGLFIQKRCFTFLKVVDGAVCFLHSSARRFLQSESDVLISSSRRHAEVTQSCLEFLAGSLETGSILEPLSSHYATINWIRHLSSTEVLPQHRLIVMNFLDGHFLPWLESLASSKDLPRALTELLRLETRLKSYDSQGSPALSMFDGCLLLIRDAIRVLQLHQASHGPPMLKVVNSLLFYLNNTLLRDYYRRRLLPWLSLPPDVGRNSNPQLFSLKGHRDWVRSCEYSPDGRFLASASDDYTIRIWDTQNGELRNVLLKEDGWIHRVTYSSMGFMAALGGGSIAVWDNMTYILRKILKPSDLGEETSETSFQDIAFSRNGTFLATVTELAVAVWSLPSYEYKIWKIPEVDYLANVAISDDGSSLAVVGASNTIHLLNTFDGHIRPLISEYSPRNPQFSPDSRYLAAGSYSSEVLVWDLESKEETPKVFSGHADAVKTVSFSADGSRIASGSADREIRIWDLGGDGSKSRRVLKGHEREVLCVAFSPVAAQHLASASMDGIISLWDIDAHGDSTDGDCQPTRHTSPVSFVTLSRDGRFIASGCDEGRLFLWNGETGSFIRELKRPEKGSPPHDGQILWLAFSPTSDMLLSTALENEILLWDVHSDEQNLKCELEGHRDWVRSAVFSPDGKRIASGSDDRTVRLWDSGFDEEPDGGKEKYKSVALKGHTDYVYCVVFSPSPNEKEMTNESYLASAGDDPYILVWDLRPSRGLDQDDFGKRLGPCEDTRSLAFLPDDNSIISASRDSVMKIWNWRSGELVKEIRAETGTHRSMRFFGHLTDYVLTEGGAQHLSTSAEARLPPPGWFPYGVRMSRDGENDSFWITYKGHNLIFLPKQYRPNSDGVSTAFVSSYKVVIGCESGAVLLFKFNEDVCPDPLGKDNPLWDT
ncbi:hypothetical protein KVR01_003761 [Diaporthe batatas]|uniref:uncharacterized protein n=1 Tax=Diaporthe batatas TaxID=748121 RepID=UPI001D0376D5|nr:uncharacterized protein KVR01_003761 [Diaporthe batatas]KAG8168072.1 hypothetical protein KVR01_003761 [Diaporthe batatas]